MQKNPLELVNWGLVWSVLVSAFVAGVAGAYPFLDPAQFNWRGAIGAFLLAFVGAIAYQISQGKTTNRLKNIESLMIERPTISTPSVQSPEQRQFRNQPYE